MIVLLDIGFSADGELSQAMFDVWFDSGGQKMDRVSSYVMITCWLIGS